MAQATTSTGQVRAPRASVGGPVSSGWRECTLARAQELETLTAWVSAGSTDPSTTVLASAVSGHLDAAREAGEAARPTSGRWIPWPRGGSLRERATTNLAAAEALLLDLAPPEFVLGHLASLLAQVQRHLVPSDPRRVEFERLAQELGLRVGGAGAVVQGPAVQADRAAKLSRVAEDRGRIVAAVRAASSAAAREQVRVRSFRNVLAVTTVLMTLLAVAIAVAGAIRPTLLPLCFAPEQGGQAVVVCPTGQSEPFAASALEAGAAGDQASTSLQDIDDAVSRTVTPQDLLLVELIGLAAAAVAAAAAIGGMRGSSERYGIPVALALLKLPTGALTAFLGLLLMRGQFVPGLSALDTSAQILAWAIVFGYGQQAFTRLVDRQGHSVLDSVRGADRSAPVTPPP